MSKFNYVITTRSGVKKEGAISASTQQAAIQKLQDKGDIVISVTQETHGKWYIFGKPSMGLQEKVIFTKSLATMIKVGITITEAFEIMSDQTKKPNQKIMFDDIIDRIKSGQSLARSLKKYDHIFPDLYINMIQTGEESGNLEQVLHRLAIQLEKEYEIRKRVVSAFIYPAVIIVITVLMSIGIVAFIMPKITDMFKNFDVTLPLPTRFLIGFSDFLTNHTLVAVAIGAMIIGLFIILPKIKVLKPFWHALILKLPVFGDILVSSNVARFARTLNSLMKAGIPIAEGLRLTGAMLDNLMYKNMLQEASDKVEQGGNLGESLAINEKLFPILATKMLYIGEKTGSLELTTRHVAQLYEKNVDTKTRNLSVMLEPFLLVFMALMVGGIALSIILPIYQLPNMIGR